MTAPARWSLTSRTGAKSTVIPERGELAAPLSRERADLLDRHASHPAGAGQVPEDPVEALDAAGLVVHRDHGRNGRRGADRPDHGFGEDVDRVTAQKDTPDVGGTHKFLRGRHPVRPDADHEALGEAVAERQGGDGRGAVPPGARGAAGAAPATGGRGLPGPLEVTA